ncbi:MAG: glycosyltransferase family 4 protein [Almyronema sp.]
MGVDSFKISIIASDLSRTGAGRWGGAVRPFLLSQALRQLGYQVEILGFADDGGPTVDLPIKAIPGGTYPRFFRSAQQLLRQIQGDLVYAYKLKPSSFGLALMHKLKTQKPVFLDIDDWELSWHGGDRWQYPFSVRQVARDLINPEGAFRQPDHPLYLRWIESCTHWADAITLHTQFLRDRFGGVYVPNGKDTHLFDPTRYDAEVSRRKYGLSNYRVLMFPGAPRPYKGLEDILAALDHLNQPDYRLVIVGGSPYDNYDEHLLQRWRRWIVKLPIFPSAEMPEVVAAAHVVVVPQQDTPAAQAQFPLKLTDGMAMAKPVLATRVGDIATILDDTGYLVDPNSPEQLADRIQWIFQNFDQAVQRGQQARQRCLQHYSIESMASLLSDLIEPYSMAKKAG